MRFVIYISLILCLNLSCNKTRRCECIDSSAYATQSLSVPDTSIIYINGNKKDSKKACVNLADSTEICNLKDK